MPHIAGVKTETNNSPISSKSKKYLTEVGTILKSEQDAENQEFERKWNDPTNMTIEQGFARIQKTIDRLWSK